MRRKIKNVPTFIPSHASIVIILAVLSPESLRGTHAGTSKTLPPTTTVRRPEPPTTEPTFFIQVDASKQPTYSPTVELLADVLTKNPTSATGKPTPSKDVGSVISTPTTSLHPTIIPSHVATEGGDTFFTPTFSPESLPSNDDGIIVDGISFAPTSPKVGSPTMAPSKTDANDDDEQDDDDIIEDDDFTSTDDDSGDDDDILEIFMSMDPKDDSVPCILGANADGKSGKNGKRAKQLFGRKRCKQDIIPMILASKRSKNAKISKVLNAIEVNVVANSGKSTKTRKSRKNPASAVSVVSSSISAKSSKVQVMFNASDKSVAEAKQGRGKYADAGGASKSSKSMNKI